MSKDCKYSNYCKARFTMINKSDQTLISYYKRCYELQNQRPDALGKMQEIENTWKSRLELVKNNQYEFDIENEGMLAAFGYHVGDFGITDNRVRHKLLDIIMNSKYLPPIHMNTTMYTYEWGLNDIKKRIRKIKRFFHGEIEAAKNRKTMKRAVSHWQCDLNYINDNYGHMAQ